MRISGRDAEKALIAVLSLVVFLLPSDLSAEPVPAGAIQAADEGLQHFLGLIQPGERENFGFSPDDRLEKAETGAPYRRYAITPAALANYGPKDPVSSLISPTDTWYFPVAIEGEAKAILTVGLIDGSWKAVGIGMAGLSKELQKVKRQWPEARGYDPLLVAVFQAATYFFTVPQKGDFNLTPLVFTGGEIGAEFQKTGERYSSLVDLSQIVDQLKAAIKRNLGQGR